MKKLIFSKILSRLLDDFFYSTFLWYFSSFSLVFHFSLIELQNLRLSLRPIISTVSRWKIVFSTGYWIFHFASSYFLSPHYRLWRCQFSTNGFVHIFIYYSMHVGIFSSTFYRVMLINSIPAFHVDQLVIKSSSIFRRNLIYPIMQRID